MLFRSEWFDAATAGIFAAAGMPKPRLIAEFGFVLWLRGLSVREYLATRDPVSATVYYVMLGAFAVMPLLVAER